MIQLQSNTAVDTEAEKSDSCSENPVKFNGVGSGSVGYRRGVLNTKSYLKKSFQFKPTSNGLIKSLEYAQGSPLVGTTLGPTELKNVRSVGGKSSSSGDRDRPPFITTVTRGRFLPSKFDLLQERSLFTFCSRPRPVGIRVQHHCALGQVGSSKQSRYTTSSRPRAENHYSLSWDPHSHQTITCNQEKVLSTSLHNIHTGRKGGERSSEPLPRQKHWTPRIVNSSVNSHSKKFTSSDEVDSAVQTDFLEETGYYGDLLFPDISNVGTKVETVNATTQISSGELFDINEAVQPIVENFVCRIMEQSLLEIMEEEENMAYDQKQSVLIAEKQQQEDAQVEKQEMNVQEELERLIKCLEERNPKNVQAEGEKEMTRDVGLISVDSERDPGLQMSKVRQAKEKLLSLLPSILMHLKNNDAYKDKMNEELFTDVIPLWINKRAVETCNKDSSMDLKAKKSSYEQEQNEYNDAIKSETVSFRNKADGKSSDTDEVNVEPGSHQGIAQEERHNKVNGLSADLKNYSLSSEREEYNKHNEDESTGQPVLIGRNSEVTEGNIEQNRIDEVMNASELDKSLENERSKTDKEKALEEFFCSDPFENLTLEKQPKSEEKQINDNPKPSHVVSNAADDKERSFLSEVNEPLVVKKNISEVTEEIDNIIETATSSVAVLEQNVNHTQNHMEKESIDFIKSKQETLTVSTGILEFEEAPTNPEIQSDEQFSTTQATEHADGQSVPKEMMNASEKSQPEEFKSLTTDILETIDPEDKNYRMTPTIEESSSNGTNNTPNNTKDNERNHPQSNESSELTAFENEDQNPKKKEFEIKMTEASYGTNPTIEAQEIYQEATSSLMVESAADSEHKFENNHSKANEDSEPHGGANKENESSEDGKAISKPKNSSDAEDICLNNNVPSVETKDNNYSMQQSTKNAEKGSVILSTSSHGSISEQIAPQEDVNSIEEDKLMPEKGLTAKMTENLELMQLQPSSELIDNASQSVKVEHGSGIEASTNDGVKVPESEEIQRCEKEEESKVKKEDSQLEQLSGEIGDVNSAHNLPDDKHSVESNDNSVDKSIDVYERAKSNEVPLGNSKLECNLKSTSKEKSNPESDLKSVSTENSNIESVLKSTSKENSNFEFDVQPASTENSNFESDLKPASTENSNFESDLNYTSKENSNFISDLKPASTENSNFESDLQPAATEDTNLEHGLKSVAESRNLECDMKSAPEENNNLENELKSAPKENNNLEHELNFAPEENRNIECDLKPAFHEQRNLECELESTPEDGRNRECDLESASHASKCESLKGSEAQEVSHCLENSEQTKLTEATYESINQALGSSVVSSDSANKEDEEVKDKPTAEVIEHNKSLEVG